MTMTKVKEKKRIPAGKNDNVTVTYTQFAANQEKTQVITGDGKEFDNDALLKLLGFEKGANGVLSLQTEEHGFEIAPNGELIRKSRDGKKVLSANGKEQDEERD